MLVGLAELPVRSWLGKEQRGKQQKLYHYSCAGLASCFVALLVHAAKCLFAERFLPCNAFGLI
jgi:hypothetical protein